MIRDDGTHGVGRSRPTSSWRRSRRRGASPTVSQ
jgi:hypothetical protein